MRPRTKHLDLPPKMRIKGKAYYYDHGGKPRKYEPLGSDKSKALLRWAEIHAGSSLNGTVSSIVDLFLSRKTDLTENTRKSYRNSAKIIKKVAGHIPVSEIRQYHMNTLIEKYPAKQMARNAALFLKTVYAWAVSVGEIEFSPFAGMRLKGQSRRERYLTDGEFVAIREKLSTKYQVAVDLAYLLGLRVSDVANLKFSDFKDGVVTIIQKKTGRTVTHELSDDLRNALERARTIPGSVRGVTVICDRKGQPHDPETISEAFTRAAKRAGIPNARFHDIRAKSASDDTENAQSRLGHARPETTQIYLRKPVVVTPIKRIK